MGRACAHVEHDLINDGVIIVNNGLGIMAKADTISSGGFHSCLNYFPILSYPLIFFMGYGIGSYELNPMLLVKC